VSRILNSTANVKSDQRRCCQWAHPS
jgi:hypothetical protein